MPHRRILLNNRRLRLIVGPSPLPVIQKVFRQLDILSPIVRSLDFVAEPPEPNEALLDIFMPVRPLFPGRRPHIGIPAIRKAQGRVVKPAVAPTRQLIVRDGRVDKIAGDIAFMVAAQCPMRREVRLFILHSQCEPCL